MKPLSLLRVRATIPARLAILDASGTVKRLEDWQNQTVYYLKWDDPIPGLLLCWIKNSPAGVRLDDEPPYPFETAHENYH